MPPHMVGPHMSGPPGHPIGPGSHPPGPNGHPSMPGGPQHPNVSGQGPPHGYMQHQIGHMPPGQVNFNLRSLITPVSNNIKSIVSRILIVIGFVVHKNNIWSYAKLFHYRAL